MHDVAEFLRRHPPFDALPDDALDTLSDAVEIEYFPRGAVILAPGSPAPTVAYVVRTGEVELVAGNRVVDARGPGELVALGEVLAGRPVVRGVRAADDTLLYRLPADALVAVLARPAGLRFVARTVQESTADAAPVDRTVGALARPAALCSADDSVAEAVRRMAEVGANCAVVTTRDGGPGILTDHDLRRRVLGAGHDAQVALAEVMTPDAVTVPVGALAAEAALVLLEHSIRHLPVVDGAGAVVGFVEQVDLLAGSGSGTFRLRRAIQHAGDLTELVALAQGIGRWTGEAVDADVPVGQVLATRSLLVEAVLRRLISLCGRGDVAFFTLGGLGRREHFPGSDLDTALAWDGEQVPSQEALASAGAVLAGAAACGQHRDPNGVAADDPRFARSTTQWRSATKGWAADPLAGDALMYLMALADAAPLSAGLDGGGCLAIPRDSRVLRLIGRAAVRHRPPTGFVRGFVVEHSGEHRGELDLKASCLRSVVGIARWAGLAARSPARSTPDRLRAGAAAGVLDADDADALTDIAELVMGLRLERHVACLRAGVTPQDFLDPDSLSPLTRRHLREAFRLLGHVQSRVEADLDRRFS